MVVSKAKRTLFSTFSRAVGFACASVYKFLFGGLDLRLSDKNTQKLANDIEINFRSLLDMYGGKVLPPDPNRRPNGFDYGIVTIRFSNIMLQIVRGRGELDVYLASAFVSDRKPWWILSSVRRVLASDEWTPPPSIYNSLDEYGQYLKTHWNPLVAAFSPQQYPLTKEKLCKFENLPFRRNRNSQAERL
jgi:hypothetical protein